MAYSCCILCGEHRALTVSNCELTATLVLLQTEAAKERTYRAAVGAEAAAGTQELVKQSAIAASRRQLEEVATVVGGYVPIYEHAAAGILELSDAVAELVAGSTGRFDARRGQLSELLAELRAEHYELWCSKFRLLQAEVGRQRVRRLELAEEQRALDRQLQRGAWPGTPIQDTSCCYHPLTGVPYLRPGPRRHPELEPPADQGGARAEARAADRHDRGRECAGDRGGRRRRVPGRRHWADSRGARTGAAGAADH